MTPIQTHSAGRQAEARPPLPVIDRAGRHEVRPDASRTLLLNGATALLYVQCGVLAIAGKTGARALPGELVRVFGLETLQYSNASRSEPLTVYELVFVGGDAEPGSGVELRYVSDDEKTDHLCRVASREGEDGALALGLDASVFLSSLGRWSTVLHDLKTGRAAWVLVLSGDATVNNQTLESGGSALVTDEDELRISGGAGADVLLLEGAAQVGMIDG